MLPIDASPRRTFLSTGHQCWGWLVLILLQGLFAGPPVIAQKSVWDGPSNTITGRPPLNLRNIERGTGLPDDHVNFLFQDNLGLVWICTDRGVANLLPWSEIANYGPKDGLLHTTVLRMAQTTEGQIYVGTHQGGIYTISKHRLDPFLEGIFGGKTIYQMVADKHNQLFLDLGTSYGYLDGRRRWHQLGKGGRVDNRKFLLLPDSTVMLADGPVYQVFDGAKPDMVLGQTFDLGPELQNARPVTICRDKVLYAMGDQLVIMDWRDGQMIRYADYPDLGRHLETAVIMPDERMLLGYRDLGMVLVDKGNMYRYTSSNYLIGNYIKQLVLDREGSVWICTYGNGIQHLSEPYLWFYQKSAGFAENSIVTVAGDASSQTMAAATSSGFYIWQDQRLRELRDTALTNIRCIAFEHGDDILTASENAVYRIRLAADGKHQTRLLAPLSGARAICELPSSRSGIDLGSSHPKKYLIATASGLYLVSGNKLNSLVSLPSGANIGHLQTVDGTVWALGQTGQAYQLSQTGQILRMLSKAQGLPRTALNAIVTDKFGITWFGTDSGLYTLPKAGRQIIAHPNIKMPIHALFRFRGQEWALTDKVLYQRQDTGWRRCQSYKTISNEKGAVNMVAFLPASNQLLMATSRGMVISNLNRWQPYQGQFNIISLGATVGYQRFVNQQGYQNRFYENQGNIRLRYQMTDYNCNGDVRFYFRLVHNGDTTYPVLGAKEYSVVKPEPGQYDVTIYGIGQEGVRSTNEIKFMWVILPLWYKQAWFVYLLSIVLVGLVWVSAQGYSNYLYQNKIRELKTVQRIQAERERISRDLHDSVGSQLVYMVNALEQVKRMDHPTQQLPPSPPSIGPVDLEGSSMAAETMTEQQTRTGLAGDGQDKYAEKLSELTVLARTTIQNLRESIWVLHQGGEIDLLNFVERIRRYLDQVKALSHVRVHEYIDVAEGGSLTPVQALNLFRMVQEAVTNVVRHSEATEFDMGVTWLGTGNLLIEVADKGKGFEMGQYSPAANQHPDSYGITNMHYRAVEIGATLALITSKGSGTRIRIELALNEVAD